MALCHRLLRTAFYCGMTSRASEQNTVLIGKISRACFTFWSASFSEADGKYASSRSTAMLNASLYIGSYQFLFTRVTAVEIHHKIIFFLVTRFKIYSILSFEFAENPK